MLTDWALIARVAAELDLELRGGRVVDGGLLGDGRFGLRIAGRRGREPATLAVDLFGSPPIVTLEADELSLGHEPGWARSLAAPLRGMRVSAVRSRPGDRVLALDFGTSSRFGVDSSATLILELIPRFGNAVLVQNRRVVAAAKQFSPAENELRAIGVGGPYQPPPLAEPPAVPRALAASGIDAQRLQALASALGPVHVYRDGARLVAAHVVPLSRHEGLLHTTAERLLPLLAEERAERATREVTSVLERRRRRLLERLARRRADADRELAQVAARQADAGGRERLRAAGDALHTYAVGVPLGATSFVPPDQPELTIELDPALDAKGNAARYFARYRKATDALPHLVRRARMLAGKRDALETLAFEAERADAAGLDEVTDALAALAGGAAAPPSKVRARRPLRIERPSGARVYLGRSPTENAELTFRIARPDDLWFHARGIPGAHVVLQAAPGAGPDEADLAFAADLAARHSRARNAARVEVDFTERKHVRKQRSAVPGLVWYTNARTRVGHPDQVV